MLSCRSLHVMLSTIHYTVLVWRGERYHKCILNDNLEGHVLQVNVSYLLLGNISEPVLFSVEPQPKFDGGSGTANRLHIL